MSLAKCEAFYLRHYRLVIPFILVVSGLLWLFVGEKVAAVTFMCLLGADIAMVFLILFRAMRKEKK